MESDSHSRPAPPGVVILGSTSPIARAVAAAFAREGRRLILAARDTEENQTLATDLRVRWGAGTLALPFHAEDMASHAAFFQACLDHFGDALEGVVLAFGTMEDQAEAQADFAVARPMLEVNYIGAVAILERFAAHLEGRRRGFIAALSSVAGDRGRQSNYFYGSAKAGLSAYLQGLRNRLHAAGVGVTTVKPGFVDTRMTFGHPGVFLVASPDRAGAAIHAAIRRRRSVVYVPWFWRYIMLIIRAIPECVFKRMRL